MEAAVTSRNRHWLFRVFELLSEGASIGLVRFQPVTQRDHHATKNCSDRLKNVSKPINHLAVLVTQCKSKQADPMQNYRPDVMARNRPELASDVRFLDPVAKPPLLLRNAQKYTLGMFGTGF